MIFFKQNQLKETLLSAVDTLFLHLKLENEIPLFEFAATIHCLIVWWFVCFDVLNFEEIISFFVLVHSLSFIYFFSFLLRLLLCFHKSC